jgi:hypothetical protein
MSHNSGLTVVDSRGILSIVEVSPCQNTLGLSQTDNSYQRNRAPPRFVERPAICVLPEHQTGE